MPVCRSGVNARLSHCCTLLTHTHGGGQCLQTVLQRTGVPLRHLTYSSAWCSTAPRCWSVDACRRRVARTCSPWCTVCPRTGVLGPGFPSGTAPPPPAKGSGFRFARIWWRPARSLCTGRRVAQNKPTQPNDGQREFIGAARSFPRAARVHARAARENEPSHFVGVEKERETKRAEAERETERETERVCVCVCVCWF